MTGNRAHRLDRLTTPQRVCDVILCVTLLLTAFLFGCFELWNVDIWWHLRAGQLIAENAQSTPWPWQWVPDTDWYTFTNADQPWIDLHWGFQLVVAGLYRLGGVPLLVLFKSALGTSAVALCLLARRSGWSVPLMVACWIPALVVLSGRLYVRPEVFTLVYLAVFLAVLFHAPRHPQALWILPVAEVLWVNSQGLFVFGPMLWVCYLIDRALKRPRPGDPASEPTPMAWKQLSWVTVLIAAACFVNPYTWRGALFPLELYRRVGGEREFFARHVDELRGVGDFLGDAYRHLQNTGSAAALVNPYLLAHLATLVLGAGSFIYLATQARRAEGRWRWDLFRLLVFAGFTYLGWQARRNNNHFALVAGFVTAANFGQGLCLRRSVVGATSHRNVWKGRVTLAVLLALLGWLIVSNRLYAWAGAGRRFGVTQRRHWYPHAAAAFAARDGMPESAFVAPWGHASSYIFRNAPQHKVFMDGRLEVNDRPTIEQYDEIVQNLLSGEHAWEQTLRAAVQAGRTPDDRSPGAGTSTLILVARHNAGHLNGSFLAQHRGRYADLGGAIIARLLQDPRWRCVYCDRGAALFVPTPLAGRLHLPEADLRPLKQPAR